MRVSKIKWCTQQENAFTQELLETMAPVCKKDPDSLGNESLLEGLDAQQTILVLLLEVLQLALEEGRLHEELINVISGILQYLRRIGDQFKL